MAKGVELKGVRKVRSLDQIAITKTLHVRATRLWKEATREALRAVVEQDLPNVDTGMARGSLLPLARAVRMFTEVNSSIRPNVKQRKGYTELDGTWNPTGIKSKATGEAFGQDAYVLSFGTPQLPVFTFKFDIRIYHYLLHENGLSSLPAWNTTEIMREAFIEHIRRNVFKILPNFASWFISGKIT